MVAKQTGDSRRALELLDEALLLEPNHEVIINHRISLIQSKVDSSEEWGCERSQRLI